MDRLTEQTQEKMQRALSVDQLGICCFRFSLEGREGGEREKGRENVDGGVGIGRHSKKWGSLSMRSKTTEGFYTEGCPVPNAIFERPLISSAHTAPVTE